MDLVKYNELQICICALLFQKLYPSAVANVLAIAKWTPKLIIGTAKPMPMIGTTAADQVRLAATQKASNLLGKHCNLSFLTSVGISRIVYIFPHSNF